jgi:hypothetical protein
MVGRVLGFGREMLQCEIGGLGMSCRYPMEVRGLVSVITVVEMVSWLLWGELG